MLSRNSLYPLLGRRASGLGRTTLRARSREGARSILLPIIGNGKAGVLREFSGGLGTALADQVRPLKWRRGLFEVSFERS